jgi:hypothetical protein
MKKPKLLKLGQAAGTMDSLASIMPVKPTALPKAKLPKARLADMSRTSSGGTVGKRTAKQKAFTNRTPKMK